MVELKAVKKKGYPPANYNPRKIHEANMWCANCGGIKSGTKRINHGKRILMHYSECLGCGMLDEHVSHTLYMMTANDKESD